MTIYLNTNNMVGKYILEGALDSSLEHFRFKIQSSVYSKSMTWHLNVLVIAVTILHSFSSIVTFHRFITTGLTTSGLVIIRKMFLWSIDHDWLIVISNEETFEITTNIIGSFIHNLLTTISKHQICFDFKSIVVWALQTWLCISHCQIFSNTIHIDDEL